MATMCRVIMARSRIAFTRGLPLLLGVALQLEMMTVPGGAQVSTGTSTPAESGAGTASSAVKAGAQGQGPSILPKDFSDLLIEPGDLLSVNVYDAPELTGSYRVDAAGDLTLPLCGMVSVRGLTLPAAAERLEAALKDGQILVQPQVTVDVLQYAGQYVTVTGEVSIPGRVPLIAPPSSVKSLPKPAA